MQLNTQSKWLQPHTQTQTDVWQDSDAVSPLQDSRVDNAVQKFMRGETAEFDLLFAKMLPDEKKQALASITVMRGMRIDMIDAQNDSLRRALKSIPREQPFIAN